MGVVMSNLVSAEVRASIRERLADDAEQLNAAQPADPQPVKKAAPRKAAVKKVAVPAKAAAPKAPRGRRKS